MWVTVLYFTPPYLSPLCSMDIDQTTFVLHNIRVFNGYYFDADTQILFDACNYSMFKYGAGTVARLYGISLCKRFIEQYKWWFEQKKDHNHNGEDSNNEAPSKSHKRMSHGTGTNTSDNNIYITSAPCKVAPTASHAVASYFTEALNAYLRSRGLPSAVFFTIERRNVLEGIYNNLHNSFAHSPYLLLF